MKTDVFPYENSQTMYGISELLQSKLMLRTANEMTGVLKQISN